MSEKKKEKNEKREEREAAEEKDDKKSEGKKAKGEKDDKEGKSAKAAKEGADEKSKKDSAGKEGEKKVGEVDPDALPPLDADGNPIAVQPDPPPTFAELWFDDPIEGEAAQKLALELRSRIELRALPIRKYLEGAIVPILLQGLQHMVLERPTNPAEYLAAFLLRNNPLKDVQYVEPPPILPREEPAPQIPPPVCACCQVHCPPDRTDTVPDFFRKGIDKVAGKETMQVPGGPGQISAKDKSSPIKT